MPIKVASPINAPNKADRNCNTGAVETTDPNQPPKVPPNPSTGLFANVSNINILPLHF